MFNAPLSRNRADYLISLFDLPESAQVLDIGCGDGKFLQLFAQNHMINGIGIDTDADLIQSASDTWATVSSKSDLKFMAEDAQDYILSMSPIDVIICIGAEYALGGYNKLLNSAKPLLKPDGKLLVGTIYWKQPPSKEYLSLMNDDDPYFDLYTTVQMAYRAGYLPLDVGRSSDDEWDRFESRSNRRHYQNEQAWDSRWKWQSGYLKWGMNTMGFCYLLLQQP